MDEEAQEKIYLVFRYLEFPQELLV